MHCEKYNQKGLGNLLSHYERKNNKYRTWIDGKPIYRRVIDLGNLPSNSEKAISVAGFDIEYIIEYRGFCYNSTDIRSQRPLPFVDNTNA